ncbi:unnamed protein product, partial [Mesorhabditis belari]|uniref:Uncharacterized protein n=1 Tax=Mesorhabditis belari TaxID=2138241 RepID=A0AAF3E9H9_9BILA
MRESSSPFNLFPAHSSKNTTQPLKISIERKLRLMVNHAFSKSWIQRFRSNSHRCEIYTLKMDRVLS